MEEFSPCKIGRLLGFIGDKSLQMPKAKNIKKKK
jgi:hypothetical protein